MSGEILDLFGEPIVPPRDGPGRPPHVRTEERARKVALLFACGHTVETVAAAMGITQPTLRKVYFQEVAGRKVAAIKFRAVQLERLNREAEKGNVAAEKALAGMIQSEQLKAMAGSVVSRGKSSEPKAAPLGKKAEAKEKAKGVAGKFGTRTPPPLLLQ